MWWIITFDTTWSHLCIFHFSPFVAGSAVSFVQVHSPFCTSYHSPSAQGLLWCCGVESPGYVLKSYAQTGNKELIPCGAIQANQKHFHPLCLESLCMDGGWGGVRTQVKTITLSTLYFRIRQAWSWWLMFCAVDLTYW